MARSHWPLHKSLEAGLAGLPRPSRSPVLTVGCAKLFLVPINLANKKKRDAQVSIETVGRQRNVKYIDEDGKLTHNVRLLKSTVHQLGLTDAYELDELADEIVKDDPEIDVEAFGRYLTETSRVYTNDNKIVFHVKEEEVSIDTEGEEKDRKPREIKVPERQH